MRCNRAHALHLYWKFYSMKTPTTGTRQTSHNRHAAETGKGIVLMLIFLLVTLYSFS